MESDSLTNEDMDLFHSYYGIASSPRAEEGGGDPMSLDSSDFQTTKYIVSELQNLKVGELLDKDADLMHDIRNLDSDMQMLVYENYNKFIAATETIKRMKNNVEDMDSDMSSIDSNMQRISSGSLQLDGSLASKRNKVEKLVRVHRLLERLQFLSGLPEKLTSMVERESFKDAVQLYKTSTKILQQYSHVLSFNNIEKECISIMDSLQSLLLNKLAEPLVQFEKRASYIGVLRAIVEDDKLAELTVNKKLLSLQSHRISMFIDMLDQQVSEKSSNDIQVSNVRKLYRLVVMNLVESARITFAINVEEKDKKDLAKILVDNTSSAVNRLRTSLLQVLGVVFGTSKKESSESTPDVREEECMQFLKLAVMDMSYIYSYIRKACDENATSPPPEWHKDLTLDFVGIVQGYLDTFMDQTFAQISKTITESSNGVESILLSATLCDITDNMGSVAGSIGKVNRLRGTEIQISIPESLRSTISTLATKAAPKVKEIVDITLSSFESMMGRIRPLYDLYKVMNFGAVEQSQRCIIDLIFRFFDRLVKVVANKSIGAENAFFCVDIYANIYSEQRLDDGYGEDGLFSSTFPVTSVMCAHYLRELAVVMSPQVLSCLERFRYFHLSSQSSDTTKDFMMGMHKINERLMRSATFLTINYVENEACRIAKFLTDDESFDSDRVGDASAYQIGKGAIAAAVELDHAMLTLCIFLDIVPPSVFSKTVVVAEVGSRIRQHPTRQQIDIEQLFADPVKMMPLMINEKDSVPFSKCDADYHRITQQQQLELGQDSSEANTSLGCTILKVALKSATEIVRLRSLLSDTASSQLKGDVAFLRLVCEALVEDVSDVHAVADTLSGAIDEKNINL